MANRLLKFTKRAVDALKAGGTDTVYWDRDLTGFGVRVYPTGGKVYIAQARGPDGPKRVTRLLGPQALPGEPEPGGSLQNVLPCRGLGLAAGRVQPLPSCDALQRTETRAVPVAGRDRASTRART